MSAKLTPEQVYQARYYTKNRKKLRKKSSDKWHTDPKWRANEQARAQRRRGELRAERAHVRFETMVAEKRERAGPTRPPRFMARFQGDKSPPQVWTSGDLGREIGRSPRAVRGWVREGVLPGASVFVGGVAFFARDFCEAVYLACERLYYLDGRGDKRVLKRLIMEELAAKSISYVPYGKTNQERVAAAAVVSA